VRTTDLWERSLDDRSEKVVVDEAGDIYVGGGGLWVSVPPGFTYASFGVVKYDNTGGTAWLSRFPHEYPMHFSEITAMVVSRSRVYLCGKSTGGYGRSFFLARLDPQGVVDWTQDFGIGESEGAGALVVPDEGTTYVTGGRILTRFPNVGYATYKVDATGNVAWEANYDFLGLAGYDRAAALAVDRNGNIYVTGQSQNTNGDLDWATIKYTPDGKEQWVRREDGPAHSMDKATAIAVDGSGNVYVAGSQTKTDNLVELVLIKYSELENIRIQPDNHVALQFFATPGQACRFQATTNFPNWADLGSSVAGSDGIVHFTDTNAPAYPYRFYRFVSP
jgi:hypothetical protein